MKLREKICVLSTVLILVLTGCGENNAKLTTQEDIINNTTQENTVDTTAEIYLTDSDKFERGMVEESLEAADGRMRIGFELDDEDISSLKDIQDNIRPVEGTEILRDDIENLNYTMNTYALSWEMGYVFEVTDDGTIYAGTEKLKQITGEGVEDWFRSLEEKYGLRNRGIVQLDLSYLEQIKIVEIVDSWEGKYKEELQVSLTKEEVEALKKLGTNIEPYRDKLDSLNKSLYRYRLNLCDDSGNILDTWDVLVGDLIADSEGQHLYVYGDLKLWLEAVEDSHDLDTLVYDRTPGDEYFSDLSNIYKGNGREEVDHTEGVDYITFDLDDDDIKGLQKLDNTIHIIDQPKEKIVYMDDIYYKVSVYANSGEYYNFFVSYEGVVYIQTEKSYQVTGEGVEEWFRKIENKYGLDKIN